MKRCGSRHVGLSTTSKAVALAALLVLTACATERGDRINRYVEKPDEWKAIDLPEADLNLPLVTPLDIKSLERRVGQRGTVEEIYLFHGVEGYVKTSRVASGTYPEAYAKSLGSIADFRSYSAGLNVPPGGKVNAALPKPFLNGKLYKKETLSRGFVTRSASALYYADYCFVARTAYLMVDLEAVEHSPDSVDIVIEVLLCGDVPQQTVLERMLVRVAVVEDRDAFREELARRGAGTS